jgi:Uncharacterized conserved protein
MPNTINDKLISWASDVEEGTIRQAEKTARLPIVDGHVALMPDAHVASARPSARSSPRRARSSQLRSASTSAAA